MASNPPRDRSREEISLYCMKKTLNKSTKLLCDNLRLDNVLPTLIAEEAVTPDDAKKIRAIITDSEKVTVLLDILIRSPVSSYQAFMTALEEERPDLYKEVKAIEEEKIDICEFDLECCKNELIYFYMVAMQRVNLLPWFDEDARDMDDIYVSLELENDRQRLDSNEDLVTIKMKNGRLAKRILVKGTVGSGKSTLMANLAYTWAQRNPRSPLYKYDLVFILSFREIQKGCSIIDAIFQQLFADNTKVSKLSRNSLNTYIDSNPNILFLLDGFDEYFAESLDIVHGEIDAILNFRTLRETCVIVTSRPHRYFGKCQSLYTLVNLNGFSSQNIEIYLSKFFNNSMLVSGLRRQFSQSEKLNTLSHTPIMLMLMCMLWEDSQSLPNKQSELYEDFTKFLWQKFCNRQHAECSDDDGLKHFLIGLGKVAFDGLMPEGDKSGVKLMFSETDFLNNLKQGYQVGLLTRERLRSKLTVSSAVMFLHKSFQEYCASYHWASLPDDNFDGVLHRINSISEVENKLEILQYLCGTCDTDRAARTIHHVIQVYLAHITDGHSVHTTFGNHEDHVNVIQPILLLLLESDFPSKYEYLTESLRSLLSAGKELLIDTDSSLWSSYIKSPLATTLIKVKTIMLIHLLDTDTELGALSELLMYATNVDTVRIRLRIRNFRLRIGNFPHGHVENILCNLGKCIGKLESLSTLDIDFDGIDMTPVLHGINTHCKFQMKCMKFGMRYHIDQRSRCDSDILCHLVAKQHHLSTLSLHNVVLYNGTMESILDAINAPLCNLRIDRIRVGNAISHIEHIIPHLHSLQLPLTRLNENDILVLGEFLPNAKNMSCLDLSYNNVGKAVNVIGSIIPQLKELNLTSTDLQEDDILTLSELLKDAKLLSELDLSFNNMDSVVGMRLCESLKSCTNLRELSVHGTDFTEGDVNALEGNLSNVTIKSDTGVERDDVMSMFRSLKRDLVF